MREGIADEMDLWPSVQRGDAGARERLASLAHEIASREMRLRGAPIADRDDLAQEAVRSTLAFLGAAREAPRDLRAFLKFRAWGVLSDHRKKMRASLTQPEIESEAEDPAGASPESSVDLAELRHALAECRARLVEEQRVVLAMRYDAHLEADAIASELAEHRNTVHVRVFRALASLRECMARKGFGSGDLR
jgi:RNA polymerase sigma factor (sigma-70 family)